MANKLPWMPFYGTAFFDDEAVLQLDEKTALRLLRLLWFQWCEGSIPTDPDALCRLLHIPQHSDLIFVLDFFESNGNGRRVNPRLEEIRALQVRTRELRAEAGRRGGLQRGINQQLRSRAKAGLKPGLSIKNKRESKKDSYSTEFATSWTTYPPRQGSNPKKPAIQAWQARCREGESETELEAGTRRYRRYCDLTNKTGTEFVMQARRFWGPGKEWAQPWTVPERDEEFERLDLDLAAPEDDYPNSLD